MQSTARAKVMNFGSNAASLMLFIVGGHTVWLAGGVMIVGVLIGSLVGSQMVIQGRVNWIRPMIVLVCIGMTGRYFWQAVAGLD